MKFELNYSTKSFLDSELLDDLKKVACELNKNTLTMQEYETYGKFSSSSYQTRFGSWLKSLELAGLSITRQNEKLGKEEIIQDLKSIAKKLNKETLTRFDYNNYGKFSPSAISNHFDGSWLKAL